MTITESLCPWLGTEEDRQTRYAEPAEGHVCYARKTPAAVELDYQADYCLAAAHRDCPYYLEPPPAGPAPEPLAADEDEVGPPPARFPILQAGLWALAILAFLAVVYVYGTSLLSPPPPTPTAALSSSPSLPLTPSPSLSLTPSQTPSFAFLNPTATPTPYPGGAVYSLRPAAGAAGWVASDESRGNHLGDSYLYAGAFDGVAYHGAFQFDLAAVPRGATVHAAVLELTGLEARRLGASGTWELRILAPDAVAEWPRQTYQDLHNAAVQWTLPPALAAADLEVGRSYAFALSPEQLRSIEQWLLDEVYTLSFRIDGPLAGADSLFAWDSGSGPSSQGRGPRLLLNVGPAPRTPIPTGPLPPTGTPTPSATPTPTDTPVWFVVTSTPTPGNPVTAAVVALTATENARTTGTPTPLPSYVATATPFYIVVTSTPTPENAATAAYLNSVATANAFLTGTPTPTPRHVATATRTPLPTSTPRPTSTPIVLWLDELRGTSTPTVTPTPTLPPVPSTFRNKILFLSDRGGTGVYVLDPDSGRVGMVTAAWPHELARQREHVSPGGQFRAFVANDGGGTPQIFVYSADADASWQLTFMTGMAYNPVWSPRGGQIAFVSTEGGNDDLFVIDTDGTNMQRLTYNEWEWDKHPTWSPDGTHIVFWSNQGTGRKQLWIIDANGRNRRLLLDSPYNDWDPVWVK